MGRTRLCRAGRGPGQDRAQSRLRAWPRGASWSGMSTPVPRQESTGAQSRGPAPGRLRLWRLQVAAWAVLLLSLSHAQPCPVVIGQQPSPNSGHRRSQNQASALTHPPTWGSWGGAAPLLSRLSRLCRPRAAPAGRSHLPLSCLSEVPQAAPVGRLCCHLHQAQGPVQSTCATGHLCPAGAAGTARGRSPRKALEVCLCGGVGVSGICMLT